MFGSLSTAGLKLTKTKIGSQLLDLQHGPDENALRGEIFLQPTPFTGNPLEDS